MDDDGYFYIVDRMKDMIISGGYNIYPREIEEVLGGHPKVREVCAIGVPDPRRGECVKVFVVLKDGETATGEALKDYCRTRMAKYKIPREIEFRETLPGTGEGADRRKELKAEELMRRQEP
jgi:long-chain acyl-CoA synthetase